MDNVVVKVKNVLIRKNIIGLSDKEALFILGAILTSYSEGFDALRSKLPNEVKESVDELDDRVLLAKLGIDFEDYEKFCNLMF